MASLCSSRPFVWVIGIFPLLGWVRGLPPLGLGPSIPLSLLHQGRNKGSKNRNKVQQSYVRVASPNLRLQQFLPLPSKLTLSSGSQPRKSVLGSHGYLFSFWAAFYLQPLQASSVWHPSAWKLISPGSFASSDAVELPYDGSQPLQQPPCSVWLLFFIPAVCSQAIEPTARAVITLFILCLAAVWGLYTHHAFLR